MTEASNASGADQPAATTGEPLAEVKPTNVELSPEKVGTLVEAIHEHADMAATKADEIERGRVIAEKSRAEIEGHLTAAKAAIATLQQQVESAKPLLLEATTFHANIQATSNQTMTEVAMAKGMLTSAQTTADSLVAAIQGHAEAAAQKNSEIEQGRLFVERSRAEIEGQLATTKDAAATLQQQLESAKVLLTDATNLNASAKTSNDQAAEGNSNAAAALQSVKSMLEGFSESVASIDSIKASAEQTRADIATKSEYIEGGRLHAEKVRLEIDNLLKDAQKSAIEAEAQHQASRTVLDNLSSLNTAAQTAKASVDSNAAIVETLCRQCDEHAMAAKKLADIADVTHQKISEYEARLAELEVTANERLKTIEGLLPGAASAGLASAFNQRRMHFTMPQRFWHTVFIISLSGLLGVAAWEFKSSAAPDTAPTWEKIELSILHRLPFALPLIWLAIHASHRAALSQRVEEDYAFKEAVSRSFEGYRREMAELEGKAAPESALSLLCTGVLSVITNPPGRIYEKQKLNQTPLTALAESAKPLADAASKFKQIKIET
jgi:predicted component of type VI protein secretion system